MGLAADDGLDTRSGGDRSEDRTTTRRQPRRCRIGGVGVGADQSGTGAHRCRRHRQTVEVEVTVQPDDHGVESEGAPSPVVDDDVGSSLLESLDDTGTSRHQDPIARIDQ